ncbi:MAG: carboxypeptidase-like regulatory domain-containing protein [Vicinamibacterales bacterium]
MTLHAHLGNAVRAAVAAMTVVSLTAQVPRPGEATVEPTGTARLACRVSVSQDDHQVPVRRAAVTLRTSTGGLFETFTDTNGQFEFPNLPAGDHTVSVEKAGFIVAGPDFERSVGIRVGEGEQRTVEIRMVRAAALEGRVSTPAGEPARGVVVSATLIGYGPTGPRPEAIRSATTDDLGRYRIHTLPAGEFFLAAAPDALEAAANSGRAADPMTGFARTYFPGTTFVDQARRVSIGRGESQTGLDIVMATVPLASMNGRVLDAAGAPPERFAVRVQPVGGVSGDVRGFSAVGSNTFTYPGVPPGAYWLLASVVGADGRFEFAAQPFDVAAPGRQPEVVVTTAPVPAIAGVVVTDDPGAQLPRGLRVVAVETLYELPFRADLGERPDEGTVGRDGVFRLGGLFGPRLFRVERLPPGWALASVERDGADISDRAVAFGPGEPATPVRLVLTRRTATLAGLVTDAAGTPIASARVVVFPEDAARRHQASRFIATTRSLVTGEYVIEGVLPGRYLVATARGLATGAWEDPATLTRLATSAVPVVVAAGDRLALSLTVKP